MMCRDGKVDPAAIDPPVIPTKVWLQSLTAVAATRLPLNSASAVISRIHDGPRFSSLFKIGNLQLGPAFISVGSGPTVPAGRRCHQMSKNGSTFFSSKCQKNVASKKIC
jgi:hypothetical protein